MSAMASQITGVSLVWSTVCSGSDQRKHQSSASLAYVRGIHRWPVNSPHKGPVTPKMFLFDDVIMILTNLSWCTVHRSGCCCDTLLHSSGPAFTRTHVIYYWLGTSRMFLWSSSSCDDARELSGNKIIKILSGYNLHPVFWQTMFLFRHAFYDSMIFFYRISHIQTCNTRCLGLRFGKFNKAPTASASGDVWYHIRMTG